MNCIKEMLMPRYSVLIVWTMVATALPVVAAYAAIATPVAPSQEVKISVPSSAPGPAPSVPSQGLRLESRPSGLNYRTDASAPALRPDDFRFDLGNRSAAATAAALNLTPVIIPSKAGWHFSGRVGPVRWLTPLDGEGSTVMRLGGRLPGQPRIPATGHFSLSFHYAF
jgi:hypothetical protein